MSLQIMIWPKKLAGTQMISTQRYCENSLLDMLIARLNEHDRFDAMTHTVLQKKIAIKTGLLFIEYLLRSVTTQSIRKILLLT